MNAHATTAAAALHRTPEQEEDTMRTLATVALSAQLAIQLIIPNPAAAQSIASSDKPPVLILQQGDVIAGAGERRVQYISGPVNAGGDAVGIAAVLNHGGEGALLVRDHRTRRETTILSHSVGAASFVINRFGILAEPLWGGDDESQIPFAIKAEMQDGGHSLLTSWGVAQRIGDSAPGLPAGSRVSDIRRIQMLQNGQTYWLAPWFAAGDSGTAFFRRQPGWKGQVDLLLNRGDVVCGGSLRNLKHYRVAENQTHAQVVGIHTGAGDRTALYVDGKCPYAVGEPLPGSTERPVEFWHFDVNSSGNVLFGAITDQPSYRDGVYVLDGRVVMREGDTIDGVRLTPPSSQPNEVRLDDRGRAVTLWTGPTASTYTIFYTPDIEHFEDTRKLISEDTPLDFDGDGIVDATLYRFRFFVDSGPTFSLGETGIHIAVLLQYPGSTDSVAAVIFYPF